MRPERDRGEKKTAQGEGLGGGNRVRGAHAKALTALTDGMTIEVAGI